MTRLRDLQTNGAERFQSILSTQDQRDMLAALSGLPNETAGVRIQGSPAISAMLAPETPLGALAVAALTTGARPVRALLFDKSERNNWSLNWHQDRTIVVKAKRDVADYGPWSMKAGLQHVAPPFSVLSGMITMRVHLDGVDADNSPLLVAPGSHRFGCVPEGDIPEAVASCGPPMACLAEPGDVWVYSTPILHASGRAARPRRRRVLQVDFSASPLDGELDWLGV